MTDAWAALAIALAGQGQVLPPTVEAIDGVLTVEWRHKQVRPGDGAVVFSGGVVAHYGVTTLRAEKLTLYQAENRQEGRAEGNVVIEDPDAGATADALEFSWLKRTGTAINVSVQVEGLYVRAEQADITPEVWTLKNAYAAPDSSKRALFSMRTPTLEYRPAQGGVARRAALSVFGSKLVTVPSYRFGRKGDEYGMRLPSVSYKQGLGLAWGSAFRLDDRSRLALGGRVKQGDRPGGTIELTRSLLPRNEPGGLRQPESDFSERFASGYFDNVFVRRPSEERADVGARRTSFTLGATANGTPIGRLSNDLITKPFDLMLEAGDTLAGWGLLGGFRYQSIQQDSGPNQRRSILSGTALAPRVDLGGGLATHLRFDGTGYFAGRSFGWAQVQAGLIYNPFETVRLGAAIAYASHSGRETFVIDRLFATRTFHGRMDFDFGTTRLSFLTKYDFERRKWFDNEIGLSQVAGPIEPFITFREFPRTVTFGVRLRAEQAFDRLRQRMETRTPNVQKPDLP